jgi:hypothetical protein
MILIYDHDHIRKKYYVYFFPDHLNGKVRKMRCNLKTN